jgi:hypothetical protein
MRWYQANRQWWEPLKRAPVQDGGAGPGP